MKSTNRNAGRTHEENIDPALMAEIRALLAERPSTAEAAEACVIRLTQLYAEAGITSQKPYSRTLDGLEWSIRTRSCMDSLDTAFLLNSIGAGS